MTWAPSFCCDHPDKEECRGLVDAFAGKHLTLHGLWPNYSDDEASARGESYPQFCGDYARCKRSHEASCEPEASAIPDEMRVLGPGYVGDRDFLANHEWPKHGSCTGLPPATYFRAALDAMKRLHMPELAGDVELATLETSFGVPRTSILLSCDRACRLEQVSVCLARDASGLPRAPVACPANTTRAQYDNGCVTRGCTTIHVPAPDACERPPSDERPHGPQGRACNHPGQGPACTSNDECVRAGFNRCARSGCCTSQP